MRSVGVSNINVLTSTPEQSTKSGAAPATHDAIRAAFARITGPQTAACLFFITSHANRQDIYLVLDKREQYLTARQLDSYVTDACKNRPQVLILSGCYSGAMITSAMTRNPKRIVLASASPTTVSDGAKTTERHLNFERCLIQAYDAGAATWRDMFHNALPCVEEREGWLRVPASKRDAYFGVSVENLRIPAAEGGPARSVSGKRRRRRSCHRGISGGSRSTTKLRLAVRHCARVASFPSLQMEHGHG